MFTMEVWFRFDPIDSRPDGYISPLFVLKQTTTGATKLGFAVANNFLRIYLDDTIHDHRFNFTDTDEYWHYIALSYIRNFERETTVLLFIDNLLALKTDIFDWYDFNWADGDHWLYVGDKFPGVVRKVKINAKAYCLTETSEWIETTEANCLQ